MDCSFFIKGSEYYANQCFYIDDCVLSHTCSSVLRKPTHDRLDSDIVGQCLVTDVLYNLNIRPIDIIKNFKINYGFDIGYKVALNSKVKALEKIFGQESDSFDKLRWYVDVVKKTNPGSYVDLEVDEATNRFKRVFDAFFMLMVVLGDLCTKGQILAATSKDGNQGIFPIALCVCDSDTEDNWFFFFGRLKKLIESQPRVITFISDRGVGLLAAFDKIFPGYPHLYCYHHLQHNLRRRFTGKGSGVVAKKVANYFLTCAYSSTEKEFCHNLKDLRPEGGADLIDDFLKDLPLERLCRAFAIGFRFGIMANTIDECFNSWISLERSMPVNSLLEEVRLKQMQLIIKRRTESYSWISRLTPNMEMDLEEEIDKSRKFRVVKSHDGLYKVRDVYSYEVDLNACTCSCMKWQINNFPCPHSLSAILFSNLDMYDFINPIYFVSSFRKCYDTSIKPISNVDEAVFETVGESVLPPNVKSQAGRRKKRRFKYAFELSVKKKIVYGRCDKKGNHNKLSCSRPIISK